MTTVFKNSFATSITGTQTTLSITSVTSSSPSAGYVTFGFATQTAAPYAAGTNIYVSGLSVSTFNGGYAVTSSTVSSVTVSSSNVTAIKGAMNANTTFTSLSGTSVTAAATYSGVGQLSTSGTGTGATFNITKTGSGTAYSGVTTITLVNPGTGYAIGDTITVNGALLGGLLGSNSLTFTVGASVTLLSGSVVNTLLFTNASATTTIIGLSLTNTSSELTLVTIQLQDTLAGTTAYYISNALVPAYQSLRVVTNGEKLILGPSTNMFVTTNIPQSIDSVISWVEIS